nr:ABC transporter permease [Anaerovorax odorimutans]
MLEFGCGIVGIFSAIFLFYTNSFLIKQRKKELALYNILGMAKRHVGKVFLLETLITSVLSLVIGLLSGIILGKLAFLLVLKIMQVTIPMKYVFSLPACLTTVIVFGIIFFVVLLCNLGRIRLSNPIELLAGGRQGEKEPKTKWLLVLIGAAAMGIGYYLALSIVSPLQALLNFFIAVILVILGTYLLFTAGSIALLKMLKKNKKFYYKTEHFTSVSGMLYRMKRNAAGLASICILSTMVLVTIATTVSMQMGVEGVINKNMPNDIQIRSYVKMSQKEQQKLQNQVTATMEKHNIDVTDMIQYDYLSASGIKEEGSLAPASRVSLEEEFAEMYVIPIEGSSLEAKYGPLADDEIIVGGDEHVTESVLKVGGKTFSVKDGASDFMSAPELGSMVDVYFVLVANDKVKNQILKSANSAPINEGYYIGIDLSEASKARAAKAAEELSKETPGRINVEEKGEVSADLHGIYGGLLFVGIFLGFLFLVATVLIIYYKQITEGYEDSERYHIMQKVGMSQTEVKKSIKSQILLVFFLPLIVAVIHVAGSFNMMSKLLAALQLTDIGLFITCTAVTILVFVVIYVLVYSLTAREYYKLVK